MEHKELYVCDPNKNVECKKTACQEDCFCTAKVEYARDTKYRLRSNSRVIETYMEYFELSKQELAELLGITVKRFKHKLLTDAFSMRDFIVIDKYAHEKNRFLFIPVEVLIAIYEEADHLEKLKKNKQHR